MSKRQKISIHKLANSLSRFKHLEPTGAQSSLLPLSKTAGDFASFMARALLRREFVTDCDMNIARTTPDQRRPVADDYWGLRGGPSEDLGVQA
jgi:hypothetical protein